MKHLIVAFLFMGIAVFYFGCSDNPSAPGLIQTDQVTTLDKKPAPHLTGAMDLTFVLVPQPAPNQDVVWDGIIDFEGGGTYGIRFHHTGGELRGKSNHFEEYFEIYDLGDPTIVYLAGSDAGVVSLANSKYRANGEVEVAIAPFEMWLGRNMHMNGIINWQDLLGDGTVIVPETAPGTFRLN